MDKSTNPVSYVGPMSEEDYLAVVERIQQAMAIEPFRPPLIDVVKLLSDWRDLSNQNERLQAALEQISRESGQVCPDFETCSHGPCQGSLAGKLIALEALARDKCR